MSVTLTIQGINYTYPSPGESPDWSEGATNWADAVTDAINGIISTGDILDATANIDNNKTSFTNITGLIFTTDVTKGVVFDYNIYRVTNTDELVETGTVTSSYNANTNSWAVARMSDGDAGIDINMTASGQLQYKSSNMSGTGYSGRIRFRAKSLNL